MSYPNSPYPNSPAGAEWRPRRGMRWQRYKVSRPLTPQDLFGLWGAIAAVVALALFLGWALEMKGGAVIVFAIPLISSWHSTRRILFYFGPPRVQIGNVILPWTDVTQFVVATPPYGEHAFIGVRLRQGMTLPAGSNVPPPNPAVPAPLYVSVPRHQVDVAKMVDKARRYAPPHIQIVVADPSGERVAS